VRPPRELELLDDRGREHRNPAVVLVSNNPYSFEPPDAPGTRATLDSGQLGVVVLDTPRLGQSPSPGRAWSATRVEVAAPAPVHAGVDGEAVELTPPLEFAIRSGPLRVRISRRYARLP
jgi:diacylglycerol kinase family enzyme